MIQGYAVHAAGAEIHAYKYDPGELRPDDVEVAITHCGICHSDVSLIDHEWGISTYPFIPGHEIVGTIAATGSNATHLKVGQRVGIGWQSGSCGHCEWCLRGSQELCPQGAFTCVGRNGGFADRVRVDVNFAVPIPDALDSATTAPLLCAGNTVYAPLREHGVNPSSRVGILGIGCKAGRCPRAGRAPFRQYTRIEVAAGAERLL
jgi:alcohol/geraniol dehydrogenase (NADP+)